MKTFKKSRSVIIAENKKSKQIKELLIMKDIMQNNDIDIELINEYLEEQYIIINKEYYDKINKCTKTTSQDINKKRNDAIDFLIKNKNFLEQNGAPLEYIKKYVDKQYLEINFYYKI